jgi:dTDP-glucose pyrophosphorylase
MAIKVLILGAGRGTRVQDTHLNYIPKVIYDVLNQPLYFWAYKSFQALITNGTLDQKDFTFVIDSQDDNDFEIEKKIREKLGYNINFVKLETRTQGPAQSAKLAIDELISDRKINDKDRVVISDCDHYFNFGELLNNKDFFSLDRTEILLLEYNREIDPKDWLVALKDHSGNISKFMEKPNLAIFDKLDTVSGIIGIYIFASSKIYIDLYEKTAEYLDLDQEFYISNMLQVAITCNYIIKSKSVDRFYSFGNKSVISKSSNEIVSKDFFYEKSTLFVDLDGTLINFDPGLHGQQGKFSDTIEVISNETRQELNKMFSQGNVIVLVTSRPENLREQLTKNLKMLDIPYNQIIMGLPGGPRALFNDQKDKMPGIEVAFSYNGVRNTDFLGWATKAFQDEQKIKIIKSTSGESGEKSFIFQRQQELYVRKVANYEKNSFNIIRYQSMWYQTVKNILPANVPSIENFRFEGLGGLNYFDTVYLKGIRTLGQYVVEKDINKELPEGLLAKLNILYSSFESKAENYAYLRNILENKALSGYKRSLKYYNIDLDCKFLPFRVNSEVIKNRFQDIEKLLLNKNFYEIIEKNYDSTTLIHGDPTFTNLAIDNQSNVILFDPIGARISHWDDPSLNYQLSKTHPIFDLSRIRLSTADLYPLWADFAKQRNSNEVVFELANTELKAKYDFLDNEVKNKWPQQWSSKDRNIYYLVHITNLCRILPYKVDSKKSEAILLFRLIDKYFDELESL